MIGRQTKNYYENIEGLLNSALSAAKESISEQEFHDVKEYIEQGEYGVGWELLWHLVNSKEVPLSDDLVSSGKMMGFDTSTFPV